MRWTYVDGDDAFSGFDGRGMGGIFGDLFNTGSNRGRTWSPPPAEFHAEISLEEAFHSATRKLRTQDGRTLEVKVPAGADNGSRVHISPDGPDGQDFYLVVSVAEHLRFRREGRDLYVDVDLPVEDAVLGAEILAPTLTGQVALTVPTNTPNERRFRLTGQGMPPLSGGGGPRRPVRNGQAANSRRPVRKRGRAVQATAILETGPLRNRRSSAELGSGSHIGIHGTGKGDSNDRRRKAP